MGWATAPWRGFELAPKGRLLSQFVDLEGPMGVAYERSVGFDKPFHVHDRLMLVCPRGATVMRVVEREPRRVLTVAGDAVCIVPTQARHADEGVSVVYDTLALFPEDDLVRSCADAAGLTERALGAALARSENVHRSRWLDEAIERYFAARVLGRAERSARLSFLEHEIVVEALAALGACASREAHATRGSEAVFERAIRVIEANLFAPFDLRLLGERVGASTSTLLRSFRREIDLTPYAYVKGRRLDEARRLLELGGAQVKEVALLVGYEEVASFSRAFRDRFGTPPSEVAGGPDAAQSTEGTKRRRRRG